MAELTRDQVLERFRRAEKLERADLRGIDLAKAALPSAALARADLEGANLEGANLRGAVLKNANLREAHLIGADLRECNLECADLEEANLERANLAGPNLLRANLERANLSGVMGGGANTGDLQVAWVDASPEGNGSARVTDGEIPALLGGVRAVAAARERPVGDRRYFGRGDILRNATLEFMPGAKVEI